MLLCTKNKEFSEGEGGDIYCYVHRKRKLMTEREEMFTAMYKKTRNFVKYREEIFTPMYKEKKLMTEREETLTAMYKDHGG